MDSTAEQPADNGLDATQLITALQDFFQKKYYTTLAETARQGNKTCPVHFPDLAEYNPIIADQLLDSPEEILKAAELAIAQLETPTDMKGFTTRFHNLPPSSTHLIRNIRSKHLKKFICIEGIVRNKGDVRPQVTTARFECPSCGNVLTLLQVDTLKEPNRCSCGRKGKFKLLSKELIDAQGLVLEEVPEQLEGGAQPKRLNIFLKNDLVSPLTEKKTNPGSRIILTGIVKEIPKITRQGTQSTTFDIIFEANHVQPAQHDFSDIKITKEEEQKIHELSESPKLLKTMTNAIAPSIYGHHTIKESLVLQLIGGVKKSRDDGITTRGDIHILLVGDPGSGKSQMLKRVSHVAPRGRFISGKGVSGAGLTASVVKDEFLGGFSLEAGALVLTNQGVCCIDELDKMSKEDTAAMHEALEGQTITISKANVQATLKCETTVLAAANPKFGRFDPYEPIASQITLAPTLINRFDLIFPIKDIPDQKKDEKMAAFILNLHKSNQTEEETLPTDFLRKYIAYARQKANPKLTDEAIEEIHDYYIKMRASATGEGIKSIPISARQLEGLVRLSEAHSKLHLRQQVTKQDAKKAIELIDYCLRQVAYDEKTGTIDIDRIATDTPAASRNKIAIIKEAIKTLETQHGKQVPAEKIIEHATEKGLNEHDIEETLRKLKQIGDIYEPRPGIISRM